MCANYTVTQRILYTDNGVNKSKDIENRVFVSYTNESGRYDRLKNNLKKSIFLVIGKLK